MHAGVCEPCFNSFASEALPAVQAEDDSEDDLELAALQRSLLGAFGYTGAAGDGEEVD